MYQLGVLSVADRGELKIEGYGSLSLRYRESNFILCLRTKSRTYPSDDMNSFSLDALDDTGKRLILGSSRVIMHDTDLTFKK